MDIGPHVLDLLLWWLGDYEDVTYRDDAMGGVEANCELELRLKSGVSGVVELSRDRVLGNMWVLRGDRATLEVGSGKGSPTPIHLTIGDEALILEGIATHNHEVGQIYQAPYERQLADFGAAIRDRREPFVGAAGKKCIELIEECYAVRQPIEYGWRYGALSGEDTPALAPTPQPLEALP
jgi:predicted dehydrogenase